MSNTQIKIRCIQLLDGKKIFYPSDDEVKKHKDIVRVEILESMNWVEFQAWMVSKGEYFKLF